MSPTSLSSGRDSRGQEARRLFFALRPPTEIQRILYQMAAATKKQYGGRQVPLPNLHLTLHFLGNLPEPELPALLQVGASIQSESFSLVLNHSVFRSRQQMLWAMPAGIPVALTELNAELRRRIESQCGLELEERPFFPHITLLRKLPKLPTELDMPTIEWRVGEFVLMESETRQGRCYLQNISQLAVR